MLYETPNKTHPLKAYQPQTNIKPLEKTSIYKLKNERKAHLRIATTSRITTGLLGREGEEWIGGDLS